MSDTRAAGLNERRCIIRDTLGLYGSIVTLATYSIGSAFDEQRLRVDIVKAVKECVLAHPVLGTTVQNAETEQPSLNKVSQVDVGSHIRWDSDTESAESSPKLLNELLEKVHNQSWSTPQTLPQWRLHISLLPASRETSNSSCFHAAFASSHSLVDGMSGLAFHTTFLQALHNASSLAHSPEPTLDLPLDTQPLLPPLDLAGNFPISWKFLLGPLLGHYLPGPLARVLGLTPQAEDVWYGANTRPQLPAVPAQAQLLPTAVHTTSLSPEVLRVILKVCRQHEVRLTGLLNVLAARALAATMHARSRNGEQKQQQQQQQQQQQEHKYNFIVDTAIDLRRCLPVAKAHMANYTSAVNYTLTIIVNDEIATRATAEGTPSSTQEDEDSTGSNSGGVCAADWKAARNVTEHLAAASSSLADQPVALLKYLNNYREWTLGKATSLATASFSMSNLGSVAAAAATTADSTSWRREQMLFSQSADGTGAPFNMNVASCDGGPLVIVMTWWPSMLGVLDEDKDEGEREFMREVCDKLTALLHGLATS